MLLNCRVKVNRKHHVRFPFFPLRRKRFQKKLFSKSVSWNVKWSDGENPVCPCNGPVYGGIPCAHIIRFALSAHRKIPLECFGRRFYYQSSIVPECEQPAPDLPPEDNDEEDCAEEDNFAMAEEDDEEEEICAAEAGPDEYSECSLELSNADEINFYKTLYKLAMYLTELYCISECTEEVQNLEKWITGATDGLVLGCSSSLGVQVASESDTYIFTDVFLNPGGNIELKQITDDLHITEASMNSTYADLPVCEFRGKLKAVMIKLIVVHRAKPGMESSLATSFQERVRGLLTKWQLTATATLNQTDSSCKSVSDQQKQSMFTASLKPVDGNLTQSSYISIPDRVREFCKISLLRSLTMGVHLSPLVDACRESSERGSKKKNKALPSLPPPGKRARRKSAKYTFVN